MAFYAPCNRVSRRSQPFFPSFQQDFTPFFRIFDELENVSRTAIRSYQPRFDVREEKDAFHLHGELPGVDQKDINIEFVDPTTLVVRGRIIKESQSATPPAVPDGSGSAKTIENVPETETQPEPERSQTPLSEISNNYRQPSVEEERDEAETSTAGAPTPATTVAEPAKPAESAETGQQQVRNPAHENQHHYWVSERSVGQFHRSFNFPGQIDQDTVTASLKNGILSIVVPKQQPKQPKRITVQ